VAAAVGASTDGAVAVSELLAEILAGASLLPDTAVGIALVLSHGPHTINSTNHGSSNRMEGDAPWDALRAYERPLAAALVVAAHLEDAGSLGARLCAAAAAALHARPTASSVHTV
jgi:hypothetical protein